MNIDTLLASLVGAFFGAAVWLLVGLYMQRRQAERGARNAARAVYFELVMNATDVKVASEHLVFQPLRRGSFDGQLPELATWLHADELETIVKAYISHAGYEQAQRDDKLPPQVRMAVLRTVLAQHVRATDLLLHRSFSAEEAARLSTAEAHGSAQHEPAPATAGARNG